jgi:hypothetical protein
LYRNEKPRRKRPGKDDNGYCAEATQCNPGEREGQGMRQKQTRVPGGIDKANRARPAKFVGYEFGKRTVG